MCAVWILGAAAASAQDAEQASGASAGVEAPDSTAPTEPESEAEAQARNDDLARNHFRAGASYFDQERYPEAAREFREAYELSGRTLLLVNMASAYERALQFDQAREALERFLELEPDSPDRDRVEARINHLERMSRAGTPDRELEPVELAPAPSEGGLGALGIAGIAGLGLGVAFGVVSLGTGLVAEDIYVDLEMRCGVDGRCAQPGIGGRIDEGAQLALTSTVTAFVAAGALAAGLTLLLLDLLDDGEGDAGEDAVRPLVMAGPEWAALSLEWEW